MSETKEHPEVQWALDLLSPDPNFRPHFLSLYTAHVMGGIMGFVGVCGENFMKSRPYLTGVHRHIIASAIGVAVGHMLRQYSVYSAAERDAVMRDYVIRHPEYFPAPEPKKWAEVLEPWRPLR